MSDQSVNNDSLNVPFYDMLCEYIEDMYTLRKRCDSEYTLLVESSLK